MSETRYAIHDSKSLVPLFDTLWTNPNPTNVFLGQTLEIDNLYQYNLFLIITSTGSYLNIPSSISSSGNIIAYVENGEVYIDDCISIYVRDNLIATRPFKISPVTDAITFEDGYLTEIGSIPTSQDVNNGINIPYKILATKI